MAALSSHPKAVLAAFLGRSCPSSIDSEEDHHGGPQHLVILGTFLSWKAYAGSTSQVRKRVLRMVQLHHERKSALFFKAWQSLQTQAEKLSARADR
jgi:hypothetical protein